MPEIKRYTHRVLVLLVALIASTLHAENRFFLENAIVPVGADADAFVRCEHDVDVLGFSISMRYAPGELDVTEVTTAGTSVAGLPTFFEQGDVLPAQGGITYGFVLDISAEPLVVLPPVADRTLIRVHYRAAGAAGTVSELRFEDGVELNTPVQNRITDESGSSIPPLLESGSTAIFDPEIERTRVSLVSSNARRIDGGTRLVLFDGRITWPTTSEDGVWTGVTFEGNGEGDESALLGGASLFVDADDDAVPDGDELLATRTPISPDDIVEFIFLPETVTAAQPLRFLLVADVSQESGKNRKALGLPFAVLALGGLGACRLGSSRRARRNARLFTGSCVIALAAACSSGGGGGGAPASTLDQVGFTLTSLEVTGSRTGATGGLADAVAGPRIVP